MDPKKVVPDGRAFEFNEAKVDSRSYMSKDYELLCYPHNKIEGTGRLEVGALKPQKKGLPGFVMRWDEKEEAVDIEISGVSDNARRNFRREENGYKGHHTKRVSGDSRIFEVDVATPKEVVFQGRIVVLLVRKKALRDSLSLTDSLSSLCCILVNSKSFIWLWGRGRHR